MAVTPLEEGQYVADGSKYYIGNANKAALVSTFAKNSKTGDFVFFVAESDHSKYECVKNVVNSQNYVAQYTLHSYPLSDDDILSTGQEAWDSSLNTINVGKYNLGWASIGISSHAFSPMFGSFSWMPGRGWSP
jgi:acyl-CoA dehydrogenase